MEIKTYFCGNTESTAQVEIRAKSVEEALRESQGQVCDWHDGWEPGERVTIWAYLKGADEDADDEYTEYDFTC